MLYLLGIKINANSQDILISVCENGHTDMIKWIILGDLDFNLNYQELFIISCINGHLIMAQWFYDNYPNIVITDEIIKQSCICGKLVIVKWLNNLSTPISFQCFVDVDKYLPNKILTKIFNLTGYNRILYISILDNHLPRIKKAIKNGAQYNMLDDFPFYRSCHKNSIEVVNFLCELDSNYYVEIEDSTIIYYKKKEIIKNARNNL